MGDQPFLTPPSDTPSPKRSELATISLVLGVSSLTYLLAKPFIGGMLPPALAFGLVLLLGIAFIGCPLALSFGIVALCRIAKSGGTITGRGLAIAGSAT